MGRVRLSRSEGTAEANQCLTPRKSHAVLKSGGYGPVRSAWPCEDEGSTPKPGELAGGEAAVKVCGVAVARLPGYSWVPNWLIGS